MRSAADDRRYLAQQMKAAEDHRQNILALQGARLREELQREEAAAQSIRRRIEAERFSGVGAASSVSRGPRQAVPPWQRQPPPPERGAGAGMAPSREAPVPAMPRQFQPGADPAPPQGAPPSPITTPRQDSRAAQDPSEKRAQRQAVVEQCRRRYIHGTLKGFQVLRPKLIFDGPTLASAGPPPERARATGGGARDVELQPASRGEEADEASPQQGLPKACGACGCKFPEDAEPTAACQRCGRERLAPERCPCGELLPRGLKFCRKCGQLRLAEHCISCGEALPSDARFCCGCGRPRNTPTPPTICSCGNKLPTDARSCRNCGAPRPVPDVCECGESFRSDANFCKKCGRPRARKEPCATCGEPLASDSLFCSRCGSQRGGAGGGGPPAGAGQG